MEEEILKGMQCTICFEPWTSSGPHQTTVLKCGHLFGRSCLLQCLQARRTCPLCNEKVPSGRDAHKPRTTHGTEHTYVHTQPTFCIRAGRRAACGYL